MKRTAAGVLAAAMIAAPALARSPNARLLAVPLLLKQDLVEPAPPEPSYRPGAISLFIGAGLALGTAAVFAIQSNNARLSLLNAIPKGGGPVSLSPDQWTSLYNRANSTGQIAAALLAGAGVLAGVGGALWWYGNRVAVTVGPGSVALTGVLP